MPFTMQHWLLKVKFIDLIFQIVISIPFIFFILFKIQRFYLLKSYYISCSLLFFFFLLFSFSEISNSMILSTIIFCCLISLLIIDLFIFQLPDELILILLIIFIYNMLNQMNIIFILSGICSLVIGLLAYFYGYLRFKTEAFGIGDLKFLFVSGISFNLEDAILYILLASSLALLYSIIILVLKKIKVEKVAFGAFLSLSYIILNTYTYYID